MPSAKQSWFTPGLRFCGSCLVSVLYWAAWLILSTSLVVLIHIVTARELPVPDFILRRVEAKFTEANFTIKFGRARLDPTGQILLEDVQLRSRQFAEPLLTSRLVYVRRNVWSILSGRPIPDEIRLEGATIQLPAMFSPSGAAEPLIRDLAAVLRHADDNTWHVDQMTGRIGLLKVTVQGNILPASHTPGAKPSSPEEITKRFLQVGRRLVLQVKQFESFEEPALNVHLESQAGIGNTAIVVFTADGANQPWAQPITTGPLFATTTLRLDGADERTVRLHATVSRVSHRNLYDLKTVSAIVSARITPEKFSVRPVEALIAIGSLAADDELAIAPVLRADLINWPAINGSASVQIGREFIGAEIEAQVDKQSARIVLEGTGSPDIINRLLAKHTPRAAPYFIFGDPVTAIAEAVLSPGWRFERLSSRVSAGRINSRDVKITSARGRIDIIGMNFRAYDAQVEMGANAARGSYWMNFISTDYRMLLTGHMRPQAISGWFNGKWWPDFWDERFNFSSVLPEADVDVQGRWKDILRTEYFGSAKARSAGVWGGKFEQVEATVFLRPYYTHVINFDATRAGGAQHLRGSLKRLADSDNKAMPRLEFDLQGNVDPETYHGMLEGKADEVLASFQFTRPPHVQAHGAMQGFGADAELHYNFTGQAEDSLRYYGFPLEKISVSGSVEGSEVRLDDIQFAVAGGKGAGKATLSGPSDRRQLGFDLYLNGADLARSIQSVQEYQTSQSEQKTGSINANNFIKRTTGGRLDVALSAQGKPGDLKSFTGTGNAALIGADLGEIQLFGLLSQALSGLSLNFSSLKLDSAHTSFRMENGRLRFPDLKITGPSAAIDARGDFVFETSTLDFTAKFKPFEDNRTLLTAAIGMVINPITSILELKLTGPLNKPDWSIDVGSSAQSHQESTATK